MTLSDDDRNDQERYPFIYRWKNNPKRAQLHGRRCRVLCRGTMNSALIAFADGTREVVSRNAVRKA